VEAVEEEPQRCGTLGRPWKRGGGVALGKIWRRGGVEPWKWNCGSEEQ